VRIGVGNAERMGGGWGREEAGVAMASRRARRGAGNTLKTTAICPQCAPNAPPPDRIEAMRRQLAVNSNSSAQDLESIRAVELIGEGTFGKVRGWGWLFGD